MGISKRVTSQQGHFPYILPSLSFCSRVSLSAVSAIICRCNLVLSSMSASFSALCIESSIWCLLFSLFCSSSSSISGSSSAVVVVLVGVVGVVGLLEPLSQFCASSTTSGVNYSHFSENTEVEIRKGSQDQRKQKEKNQKYELLGCSQCRQTGILREQMSTDQI